jgi:putative acetyltransferase
MSIIIRPIEKRDNKALAKVIRTVLEEFNIALPGTAYTDPTTDDIYKLFTKPGSEYWVAEEDGRVLGGCGLYATDGLPAGCVELVKLYLYPDVRGRGIGKQLIQKCFEASKKRGYKQIYLEAMPELVRALEIYEKLGFKYLQKNLGASGHPACNIWMIRDV